jgi:5-methylcytosine-specific restriction endonuclease McrA
MNKNKVIFGFIIIMLLFFAINTKYGGIFMHINKSFNYVFKFSILALTLLTIFFPSIFESDLYIDMRKGNIEILPDNPIILSKNIKKYIQPYSSNNITQNDDIHKVDSCKSKSNKSTTDTNSVQKNIPNYTSTKYRRKVTESTKKYVASKQKWKCFKCKMLLDCTYEIDHIKPLYLNGTNDVDNLQALCRNCHGKKTTEDRIFN